jgi:photosystem II stability/assembly factor-like uncharacterized protein
MRQFSVLSKATIFRRSLRRAGSLLLLLILLLAVLTACASNTGILGGGNWQASGLQKQDLRALAVDPNHLQNMYAGDAQDGVFASTNAGVTWKRSSLGLPASLVINALAFDLDGKKLYAATSVGVFVSSDSASTWSRVKGVPTDNYSALAFDVNTPQVVYLASDHSGVLMSRDAGVDWTRVSTSLPTGALTSVLYDPNQKDLWAAYSDRIYRSSDNGATWRAMSVGLPANVGINALALGAVTSGSSDLIFAGTNHGFFLSSDAGQHWAQGQFSLADLKISAILLDANQPNEVYVSTTIGVLRSTDSGQNWNQVASGLPNNQAFAGLAQGDTNYTQLILASHNGIYRYPGTGSVLDPSRIIPIILILLFFVLLYYFFARRTRRLIKRAKPSTSTPVELNKGTSFNPPARDGLNGSHPPSDSVLDLSKDEKEES